MSQKKPPEPPRPRPQFFSWPVEGGAENDVVGVMRADLVKAVIPCRMPKGEAFAVQVISDGLSSLWFPGLTADQAKKFVQIMHTFLTGYDFLPGLTVGLDLVEKNAKTSELEIQKPPLVLVEPQ